MVQAHIVPQPADTAIIVDDRSWPSIKVELQLPANAGLGNTQINVIDPHGKLFGRIDAKTAQGLCPLLCDAAVSTVDVTARLNTRTKLPQETIGVLLRDFCTQPSMSMGKDREQTPLESSLHTAMSGWVHQTPLKTVPQLSTLMQSSDAKMLQPPPPPLYSVNASPQT